MCIYKYIHTIYIIFSIYYHRTVEDENFMKYEIVRAIKRISNVSACNKTYDNSNPKATQPFCAAWNSIE